MILEHVILIFVLGAIGALASDITNRNLCLPKRIGRRDQRRWDPGTPGNMFVGGVASFAFWGFRILNQEAPIAFAAAAVCGFAGARILHYLTDNKLLSNKKEGLKQTLLEGNSIVSELSVEVQEIVQLLEEGEGELALRKMQQLSTIPRIVYKISEANDSEENQSENEPKDVE